MSEIKVIKATTERTEVVLSILFDAVEWLESQNLITWNKESLKKFIPEAISNKEVYLLYLDNEPAGTITLQWSDETLWGKQPPNAGYIHKLAVPRKFAGKGVGALLVDWAEKEIAKAGLAFARLDCDASSLKVNSFYRKLGYRYVGITEKNGLKLNLYEKNLV